MLLDTSGLLCLHNRAEPFHAHARTFYGAAHIRLTHSDVLAEFIALANARRLPRVAALTFVIDRVANPDIETVWVDEALHREALALFIARQDKTYSLCDAVSFVLVRQRHLTEALTTDRHAAGIVDRERLYSALASACSGTHGRARRHGRRSESHGRAGRAIPGEVRTNGFSTKLSV
jgi:uncharacterized protein